MVALSAYEAIMLALGNAMDEPEDLLQLVLGMTGSTIFNEIFSEAIDVQKTRLSEWFDEKSKTFGGESAIETIKTLVGHTQSFDLTGLQSVPPLDLPNLQSFFLSSLVYNSRRPEIHGKEISFKTPQLWMNHPSIKSSYSCLYFDRSYRSESGSVCGVGHPIFDQAIDQALSLESPLARIQFLPAPLALFLIFDRVTDTGVLMRETLVGVLLSEEGFKLLKDWEILLTLAEARGKETKNDQIHNDMDLAVLTNLFVDAKNFLEHHLPSLGLPYKIPSIRDHALLMPI